LEQEGPASRLFFEAGGGGVTEGIGFEASSTVYKL
jgi:hypothetical protein